MTNLQVTEALIERENAAQLKKWLETRGELQYRPSRRLHGSRAIHEERRRQLPPLGPSSSLLSLPGLKSRGSRAGGGVPSPPPPVRRASAGPAPGPVVTAEGLRPSLPSPTGNSAPLAPSGKEARRQEKERQKQEKEREKANTVSCPGFFPQTGGSRRGSADGMKIFSLHREIPAA